MRKYIHKMLLKASDSPMIKHSLHPTAPPPSLLLPHSTSQGCCGQSPSLQPLQNCSVQLQQTQTYIPGDGAVAFDLTASDEVPDAGHPMAQQGECGHEQGEDHGAVLRVAVQLL